MRNELVLYEKAVSQYEEEFKLTDDVLYDLCKSHPGHTHYDKIVAKCCIIGRTYATGIERLIKTTGAMAKLTRHMSKRSSEITKILNGISNLREPLTASNLEAILRAHAKFIDVLKDVTSERKSAISFISKYMHFHQPLVPIYDSIAVKRIRKTPITLRWNKSLIPPELSYRPHGNNEYFRYCCRFLWLYHQLQDTGRNPTVRLTDYFLLYLK